MPYYPNARVFRQGADLDGENRQQPIASNFSLMAPSVYDRNNPSPYTTNVPAFTPVRPSPGPTFTPVRPSSGAAFSPVRINLDSPNDSGSPNGAPLPLGAPVPGQPGVYQSGDSTPALNDPLARSAPRSRYTLTSTGGGAGPMADPAYQNGASATMLALQQIYNVNAGPRGGTRPTAGAAYNPQAEFENTGGVLAAAQGLEAQKTAYAVRDIIGGDGRSRNAKGELLDQGANPSIYARRASDLVVSPYDTPEVRYRKQEYAKKLILDEAQKDPRFSRNGQPLGTEELAAKFQQMMKEANQPRYINLGKDSAGRPVEGTVDRNHNFSRISPAENQRNTGVQQVQIGKKNYFYHGDSKRYFDETGNPVVFPSGDLAAMAQGLTGDQPPAATSAGAAAPAGAAAAPAGAAAAKPDMSRVLVHIAHLKANPSLAAAFNEKYGNGAAETVLGK